MIARLAGRMRSIWRGMRRSTDVDGDMREEFRVHVELRTEDLMRRGLSPTEAARQARSEFGNAARYHEEGRSARGLRRFDALRFSWLDFKLGFRMLTRYPGLTVVGGLAMAFAIWVGADTFELTKQWIRPSLSLDDGDRIVGIELWHRAERRPFRNASHDFLQWREELKSVAELSAFRMHESNLSIGVGGGEPVKVAEITASAFRVTRVPALLGRFLVDSDEVAGAPQVVVIGYDVWQTRFSGDRNVVGRPIRLGNVDATVVGVMPRAYAFPVYQQVWTPLRLHTVAYEPGHGPAIRVFGRLADGTDMAGAQSELNHLGLRAAAAYPQTHEHLRPRVMPYARSIVTLSPSDFTGLKWVNVAVVLLVVLACGNVALLIFARAATRESEIVVRNALGASRGRIIMQLFAEALVLGGVGTVLGLTAAKYGLRFALSIIDVNIGPLPFWVNASLSRATLLYAVALTIIGAIIAGAVPALRVTRAVGARLRQTSAGGGGLKFSGLWTVVIVAQVAVTIVSPVAALLIWRAFTSMTSFDVGFAEHEYLSARLELDVENAAGERADASRATHVARFRRIYQDLERRLATEPAVGGVTFATHLPRRYPSWEQIDIVEDVPLPADSVVDRRVKAAAVDVDYLEVLGAPILAGRGFHAGDLESGQRVVVVNQSFVAEVLRGHNPIGRRLRFTNRMGSNVEPGEPGPWYEIIGVVKDLGMYHEGSSAGVYHPLAAGTYPLNMIVRVRGDPAAFAPRLRAVATAVEPTLRLYDIMPMNEYVAGMSRAQASFTRIALFISAIALLLCLAGVYAVMSFAVSRRTREIGIRVALGADAKRVIFAVFRRPLAQLASGVALGAYVVVVLVRRFTGTMSAQEIVLLVAYAALMTAICLLACIVPTRRALAVEPTDALRADA